MRLNLNGNGGGIMFSIRNNISAKVVSTDDRTTESFYVELNFRKKKWLLICSYDPSSVESDLDSLSKSIDSLSSACDNFILLADFNSCIEDSPMKFTNHIMKSYKRANML